MSDSEETTSILKGFSIQVPVGPRRRSSDITLDTRKGSGSSIDFDEDHSVRKQI
jgi:hypothetical protein